MVLLAPPLLLQGVWAHEGDLSVSGDATYAFLTTVLLLLLLLLLLQGVWAPEDDFDELGDADGMQLLRRMGLRDEMRQGGAQEGCCRQLLVQGPRCLCGQLLLLCGHQQQCTGDCPSKTYSVHCTTT